MTTRPTDEEIRAWAARHDLQDTLTDLRCAFEDAAPMLASAPISDEKLLDGCLVAVQTSQYQQPVRVPDEAVLAACRRYQKRLDEVCHHHDLCEAMEDAERLALIAFRKAMLSTSPQPQQTVPDGLSPVTLAVIGRKHFGNPIPKEWYAAAKELLSAAPAYNGKKEG